ncbi:hypothetical protein QWY85_14395 [Neolewinella lacunae]|uniref:Uncharacterized protein n=1 Tax=Neolewinella lacunae TaxID=1517758 RepID=A0A923PI51_9BACT|nr:hypothetical protein [Neolewinella lacunae]MBC6993035.1 hypothetical protein [Neolewinella lacunae]MDN3635857.1 hypothetical protein [Neolewinella lacunae]
MNTLLFVMICFGVLLLFVLAEALLAFIDRMITLLFKLLVVVVLLILVISICVAGLGL